MRRARIPFVILFMLLIGAAAAWWFGAPRVTAFSPSDDALDVQASSNLSLTFSRRMQPESVIERLTLEPAVPGKFSWDGNILVFNPLHPWPAGATVQVRLAEGARSADWLSLPVRQETTWSFTVRRPRLLYLYPSDAAANIYLYDPRTEQSQPITDLLAGVQEFDATVDGSAVYYSVQNNLGGSDIYRLELGQDLSVLEAAIILACQQDECRAPRISPQEDFLAYERTTPPGSDQPGYPQVWVASLLKSSETDTLALSPDQPPWLAGDSLHQTIQPDWSAQGLLSFYDSSQDAFIVQDLRGGGSTELPNQTGEPGSWDPGGKAYVAPEIFLNAGGSASTSPELNPVTSSHLLRFNIEDGTIEDLTQAESLEDTSPVFSPDGSYLAFARKYLDIKRWTPGRQLWIMSSDGSESRQLTNDPDYNHFDFAWEPTGDHIAFVRFNQAAPMDLPTIWVYDLVKDYQTEIIIGGYSPHWIP